VISGGSLGVDAFTETSGAIARIAVTRSSIKGTIFPLVAQTTDAGSASIAVSGSKIVNNNYAWFQFGTGSTIRTSGNNQFTDNPTSSGVLTPSSLK
jgi:hypothetical protein